MLTRVFNAFFHSRQNIDIYAFTVQQFSSNSRILLSSNIRLLEYSEEYETLTINIKESDNLFVIATLIYMSDDIIPITWVPNFIEENNSLVIHTYKDGQVLEDMIFTGPTRLFIHNLYSLHDKELNSNVTIDAIPYSLSGPKAAVAVPILDASAYIEGVS